jgi:hypothetical protein
MLTGAVSLGSAVHASVLMASLLPLESDVVSEGGSQGVVGGFMPCDSSVLVA